MRRGCASDKTDDRNTCTEVNNRCVLCNQSGCNTRPATTQSTLACIQCSNSAVGCAWGHQVNEGVGCSPVVIFPNVESCYTFTHDNGTVTRGCTLDNQLCTDGDQRCRLCSTGSCNNQNVITQSCKVCRSDLSGQENCGSETVTGFNQLCGTVVKYENRGCYAKRQGSVLYVFLKVVIYD